MRHPPLTPAELDHFARLFADAALSYPLETLHEISVSIDGILQRFGHEPLFVLAAVAYNREITKRNACAATGNPAQ